MMRVLRSVCAGLAAVFLSGAPRRPASADCRDGWLAYADGIAVAPLLAMAENPRATLVVDRCSPGEVDVEWVVASRAPAGWCWRRALCARRA